MFVGALNLLFTNIFTHIFYVFNWNVFYDILICMLSNCNWCNLGVPQIQNGYESRPFIDYDIDQGPQGKSKI